MLVLYLVAEDAAAKQQYMKLAREYLSKSKMDRECGFELICADYEVKSAVNRKVSQKCSAALYDDARGCFRSFWIISHPRICSTPLRMTNSVDVVSASNRDPLIVNLWSDGDDFHINFGDRYFQIVAPELLPFNKIEIVNVIPTADAIRSQPWW